MMPATSIAERVAGAAALGLALLVAMPVAAQTRLPVAAPAAPATPPAAVAPMPRFVLRGVTFDRSAFLPAAELQAIAAPLIGREVGAADLEALVAAVNRAYDRRGLATARAVLAPPPFRDGIVHVTLVEGRLGAVSVAGARRLTRMQAIDRAGLVGDATVDLPALRHRLALLNRATDTQIRAQLQPGAQFGLTDVQLSVAEPRRNVVELSGDDDGYDSAGKYQGNLYYRRTGILGASDRFTGFFSGSAGLLAGTASYDAPLLGDTSRVALSYGRSQIDIVDGPYAALRSRGVINNEALGITRPLASSERGILFASLTAGISDTRNTLGGTYVGESRTHRAGGGLSYSYTAPGTTATLSANALWANAPVGRSSDSSDFALFSGLGSAEHLVGGHAGLRLAGGWQVATASGLPSDLLFQIGGATTVRGYRQGALTGDGGYYLNLEAELFPFGAGRSTWLFGFLDQGRIFTRFAEDKALSAAGVGAAVALGRHLSLRVTGGLPLQRVDDEKKSAQVFARVGLSF